MFSLITADVQAACDILSPVFDATGGVDGRVSVEVSPAVAHDAAATLAEAHQLTRAVDRPNLFVKIPATPAGLTAIADATAAGISINVTLIFGLDRYRQVIDAYLTGLERARDAGLPLGGIQSVASFFVSRVDVEVDRRLEAAGAAGSGALGSGGDRERAPRLRDLRGDGEQRALACTRASRRESAAPALGVDRRQEHLDARHGLRRGARRPSNREHDAREDARGGLGSRDDPIEHHRGHLRRVPPVVDALDAMGISLEDVSATLEAEGIAMFSASWERLIAAVAPGAGSR